MRPTTFFVAAAVGVIAPVAFAMPSLAQSSDDDRFDRDSRSNGNISIAAASSEVTGDVSFLIVGSDLNPFMPIEVNSPAVDAGCTGSNLDGLTATTDRNGYVDVLASADDCVPGTYRISVSEQDTPFRTFSETVDID